MRHFYKYGLINIGINLFQKLNMISNMKFIPHQLSCNPRKSITTYTRQSTFVKDSLITMTSSALVLKALCLVNSKRAFCKSQNVRKFDLIIFIGGVGKKEHILRLKDNVVQVASEENSTVGLFGEDAAFALITPRYSFLGVADGVGGYRDLGIDPSIFSSKLMKYCSNTASKHIEENENPNCKQIMEGGYNALVQQEDKVYGGSTVIISYFDHLTGDFNVSNLGDSRVMIIQPEKGKTFLTEEQQHYFNCPYQLSIVPDDRLRKREPDSALDTSDFSFSLSDGDMFLIGTDGFFDNMFQEEVMLIVKDIKNDSLNISEMYKNLLKTARTFSLNDTRVSPFSVQYKKYTNKSSIGGKEDDITLIFGLVVERKK